jgi:hypothetical protein
MIDGRPVFRVARFHYHGRPLADLSQGAESFSAPGRFIGASDRREVHANSLIFPALGLLLHPKRRIMRDLIERLDALDRRVTQIRGFL